MWNTYTNIYDDDITCNHGNTVNKLVSIFFSGTFLGGKILRGGQLVGQILSRCHMAECSLKNLNGTTKIKIWLTITTADARVIKNHEKRRAILQGHYKMHAWLLLEGWQNVTLQYNIMTKIGNMIFVTIGKSVSICHSTFIIFYNTL